jgi:hypothetical protein
MFDLPAVRTVGYKYIRRLCRLLIDGFCFSPNLSLGKLKGDHSSNFRTFGMRAGQYLLSYFVGTKISIYCIMKFQGGLQMPAVLELEKKRTLTNGDKKAFNAKIRRLRSLLDSDKKEQSETFAYLKKALDEDRPSNRRLFK